jgi:hypothetical protein
MSHALLLLLAAAIGGEIGFYLLFTAVHLNALSTGGGECSRES